MMAIPKEIQAFYPFKITGREDLSKMARNDKICNLSYNFY